MAEIQGLELGERTRSSRATQADIAREAGVSVSTVSRVLANEPGISADVRSAIRDVARQLGYRIKPVREDEAAISGPLLALVAVEHATSELGAFYEAVLNGMRQQAERDGAVLTIRLVREASITQAFLAQYLAEPEGAGLFLVGIDPSPELAKWLADGGTPVVLVNGADPDLQFDCVSPSNFYAAQMATRKLLDAGHRHIVHISGAHRHTTLERYRGFVEAIGRVDGARGYLARLTFIGNTAEESRVAMEAQLAAHPEISAAFCMNDNIAVGVLQALETAGRRVPEDFAVIGFDNLPCAAMTTPRLTTLEVDRDGLGREAFMLMRRRIAEPDAMARQVQMGVRLIVGGTV
jgi:DNA-binding LacI/PurR family transcriptional regulator